MARTRKRAFLPRAREVMQRQLLGCAGAVLCTCAGSTAVFAQAVEFVDVAAARGLGGSYAAPGGLCAGAVAADYDNDGDIDLFVPQTDGVGNLLFRNDGDGTYTEIASEVGVDSLLRSRGALWFDYDGDGDLDLLVLQDHAQIVGGTTPILLYRQDSPIQFTDVTEQAGLLLPFGRYMHVGGVCAGDLDGDGYLDLCIARWDDQVFLYRNAGDGTFEDISESSGVGQSGSKPWQPMMFDADGDGLLDIFIAMDVTANHLWMNQGDGTFVDEAVTAGVAFSGNEMGVTIGDYDNDGLLDIYVTNINIAAQYNTLFRNVSTPGSPAFVDVSAAQGVNTGGWGWGTSFLDADRDGLLDLAATNGRPGSDLFEFDESILFFNNGETFDDVSDATGFNDTHVASCLLSFDADRDGDLDVLQVCHMTALRLLDNRPVASRGVQPNWITIKPRQDGPNHFAIGAIVRASIGETTMTRLIHAGCSTLGQEPAEAHFGLGNAANIDQLTIHWPDGEVTIVNDVVPNQVLTVSRPAEQCPGDVTGDGDVGLADLLEVISNWGSDGSEGGDVNGDAAVDLADLLQVISNWGSTC